MRTNVKTKNNNTKNQTKSSQKSSLTTQATSRKKSSKLAPSEDWTEEQFDELMKAYQEISTGSTDFWQQVAQAVHNKTASQCCEKIHEACPTPKKKGRRKKETESGKDKLLAGKLGAAGTAKRKRNLREYLKSEDASHNDDIFEFAPEYPKRKLPKFHSLSDDDQLTVESSKTKTPMKPEDNVPDLLRPVDRDQMDLYVNNLKNNLNSNSNKSMIQLKLTDKGRYQYQSKSETNLITKCTEIISELTASDLDKGMISSDEDEYYFSS